MYRVGFILATLRSGTTYFRNILASNQNILTFPRELNSFWTEYGQAPCGVSAQCPACKAEDLTDETRAVVQKFFYDSYKNRNSVSRLTYRTYRKFRYNNETVVKKGQPFYVLNKSTHLLNKISYVNSIFPESRFIFILRDIYSQCNSLKRHLAKMDKMGKWLIQYPSEPKECWRFIPINDTKTDKSANQTGYVFRDICRYWIEQNSTALRDLEKIPRDRKLFIKFSDITNNIEKVLSKVETFLEID